LPGGLTLNTATGALTGTPTASGTTSLTVQVTNASGSASAQLTLNISPATSGSWQSRDIGAPAVQGTTSNSGSSITVSGSGVDIWGTADAFQFAYQSWSGDGTITARVVSMTEPSGWAKAG